MEDRAAAGRFVTAALRIAVGALMVACAPGTPARPVATGDSAPALAAADQHAHVLWLLREDDLLGCRTRARELRALNARHGPRMRLTVVVVGKSSGLAEGFLRRERLEATLATVSQPTYREQLGDTPLPALLVIDDARVQAVWSGSPDESATGALAALLETLVPD